MLIIRIREKLVSKLKNRNKPLDLNYALAFTVWMTRVLTINEQKALADWEKKVGTKVTSKWVDGILSEAGNYIPKKGTI